MVCNTYREATITPVRIGEGKPYSYMDEEIEEMPISFVAEDPAE
jgi:hypothetical protein